jgi:hypothetical protein
VYEKYFNHFSCKLLKFIIALKSIIIMGFLDLLFTGTAAIVIGIILGIIIAIVVGFIIYGIVKVRDRNKYK